MHSLEPGENEELTESQGMKMCVRVGFDGVG